MGKLLNVAAAGVLLAGAYTVVEGVPDCLRQGQVQECLTPDIPGLPNILPDGKTGARIGNLVIASEVVTDTAQIKVFGEVRVNVNGQQSTFDFDAERYGFPYNRPGVDATMFWNASGKGQDVIYNPCLKEKDSYTDTEFPDTTQTRTGLSDNVVTPTKAITYKLSTNPDGTVNEVTVDAGFLDACFMRTPNTENNQLLWSTPANRLSNRGFGDVEEATFRWAMQRLVEDYAKSQAGPAGLLNIDAVKLSIQQAILGDLVAKNPRQASLYAKVMEEGKIKVNLAGPEVRRKYYEARFEETKAEFSAMDRSFPDPANKGRRYKLEERKLGTFAVRPFEIKTPISVTRPGEGN